MSRLDALREPIVRNSAAIMASTLVTSGLGFLFWILVARVADPATSGFGAAFASGVQLLAVVSSIGVGAALIEWLPRVDSDDRWRQFVTSGLLVATVTSLIGGLLVVGSTALGLPLVPGLDEPLPASMFVASAVLFSVGTVIDHVSVSETRGVVLLIRNTILCGLRLPFFAFFFASVAGTDALLLAWTGAAAVSLVYAWISFARRGRRSLAPDLHGWREHAWTMRHSLVGQHLITVAAMVPGYLLPLVVVARLSLEENAYFYITWMLGSVFFMVSPAVSTALFASVADRGVDAALVRRGFKVISALLVVPIVVYLVGGRLLLSIFGAEYAAQGTTLLILLTLSAIPDAITNVAVAVLRATGRMWWAFALNGAMAIGVTVGAWILLPSHGIDSVGVCWLAAQTVGAVAVLVMWRRIVPRTVAAA